MLVVSSQLVLSFLLVFARVAGVFAFVPLPGANLFPAAAKVTISLLLTIVLLPLATIRAPAASGFWTLALSIFREAGFGVAVGLTLQFLSEMLGLAAQLLGFQAGYSYINTVDPSTMVDATILNVLLTLVGGLLFFSFDLHLHFIRALARSLEAIPVGEFNIAPTAALHIARLGAAVFETAVRLAFPVIAVLLLLDLALALLTYINARLQLLSLSFPVKMIVTMASLYVIAAMAPRLYHELAQRALAAAFEVAGGTLPRPR